MNCQDCEFYELVKENYQSKEATLFYINFNNGIWIAACEDHAMPKTYTKLGFIHVSEEQFKKSLLLK